MRIRTATSAAVLAATALLALTACSDDDKSSSPPATSAPEVPSASSSAAGGSSGIDPQTQALLIASLQKIDPNLAGDPAKTAADAEAQCAVLASGGDAGGSDAAAKFGSSDHPLTDSQGQAINAALKALVCDGPSLSDGG